MHDLSVFMCISMLARAVGTQVEKDIRDMLEPMFAAGLSPELTSATKTISQEIPGLQREFQGYLNGDNLRILLSITYVLFCDRLPIEDALCDIAASADAASRSSQILGAPSPIHFLTC